MALVIFFFWFVVGLGLGISLGGEGRGGFIKGVFGEEEVSLFACWTLKWSVGVVQELTPLC